MRRLIYSMSTSLDGYIKGPDGSFDWSIGHYVDNIIVFGSLIRSHD